MTNENEFLKRIVEKYQDFTDYKKIEYAAKQVVQKLQKAGLKADYQMIKMPNVVEAKIIIPHIVMDGEKITLVENATGYFYIGKGEEGSSVGIEQLGQELNLLYAAYFATILETLNISELLEVKPAGSMYWWIGAKIQENPDLYITFTRSGDC